jgi:predicted ATP-dependent endonuclease of OLD family
MRITKLELQNFKRFTELTIDKIPETSKLVLLIGANGSGKSSVFDAFDFVGRNVIGNFHPDNYRPRVRSYYSKNNTEPRVWISLSTDQQVGFVDDKVVGDTNVLKSKFIGRSSIRIVPRTSQKGTSEAVTKNSDGPLSFIDADERFDNDLAQYIQHIDNALREPVFSGRSADTLQIFLDSIRPLNQSLLNILGGDEHTTIQLAEFQNATARESARLIFKKGSSKINYDLLSHGEKQIELSTHNTPVFL